MDFHPPKAEPGVPIRAADRNALNREIARLGRVRGGGDIDVRNAPGGLQVSHVENETIYLRLTGPANSDGGYSWIAVYAQKPGAWVDGSRTGDQAVDPAYDRFGSHTLPADKTVYRARRAPTSGAWIFRAISKGGCDTYCIGVTGCGEFLSGVTISLKNSEGNDAGTSTTVSQISSIQLINIGSEYVDGIGYTIGIDGGGGGGAFGTFDIVDGCVANVQLTSAGSGFISAPSITFPGAGLPKVVARAVAIVACQCCFPVEAGVTYQATITAKGYQTITISFIANNQCDLSVDLKPTTVTLTGNILGCGFTPCVEDVISGANVVVRNQVGQIVYTGISDANGQVNWDALISSGQYSVNATKAPRFLGQGGSGQPAIAGEPCLSTQPGIIHMGPSSGYMCLPNTCNYPVKKTLHVTCSLKPGIVLTSDFGSVSEFLPAPAFGWVAILEFPDFADPRKTCEIVLALQWVSSGFSGCGVLQGYIGIFRNGVGFPTIVQCPDEVAGIPFMVVVSTTGDISPNSCIGDPPPTTISAVWSE